MAEEIRLGLIVQQDTVDGPVAVRTVGMAVEAFNAAGGLEVDGQHFEVKLVVGDTGGRPEEATRVALGLINQQRVFALIGPARSVSAIPVSEVAENARIPMISHASTHVKTTVGKRFVFRTAYTNPVQAAGMARFALETLGATTAAVLFDVANPYGRELAEAFRDGFGQGGGEVSVFAGYVQRQWQESLGEIRERAPDVVFLPNFDEDIVPQARQLRALGITATLLGGDSWSVEDVVRIPEFEGAYLAVPWHATASVDNPVAMELLGAYEAEWGEPLVYYSPVMAHDAARMIFEALRRAGRPDPEAVREALADLVDFPGATGDITFRGTDGDPAKQGVVLALRDGRVYFVQRLGGSDRAEPMIPDAPATTLD